MVSNIDSRTDFINSSYKFLTKFGFNGVDFDWEYPGQNSALDFYGLECLIKEYKIAHPDMYISMQCSGFLSGNVVTLDMDSLPGYTDVVLAMKNDTDYFTWLKRLLNAGLDNINIMAYDSYTAYSEPKLTRHNAPLYNKEYPSGSQYSLNLRPKTIGEIASNYKCTSEPSTVRIKLNDEKYRSFRAVYQDMRNHYLSSTQKLLNMLEESLIEKDKSREPPEYRLKSITNKQLNEIQRKVLQELTFYYTKCQEYYQEAFAKLSDALYPVKPESNSSKA
jgi:GH18 family chitinase